MELLKNQKFIDLALIGTALTILSLTGCKAKPPGRVEKKIAQESKELIIGGKDWHNPVPDDALNVKEGGQHFQYHCQVCHGLDGHATGVPFARNMSPPVPDLATTAIQKYADGQMKWIIENGIRMTGMPGWKGLLDDKQMWQMVRYIRHLPSKGSLGVPEVFLRGGNTLGPDHEHTRN